MKRRLLALFVSQIMFSINANASASYIGTNPSVWKIENYVGQQVAVWNTGSSCNGLLTFSASATAADLNRFWATVATAKVTGKRIFVRYEDAPTGACPILSFGFDSE